MSNTKNNNSNIEDLFDLIRGKTTLSKIVNKSDGKPKKQRKAKEKKFNTSKKKIEPVIQYVGQDDKNKPKKGNENIDLIDLKTPKSVKLKKERGIELGKINFEQLKKETPILKSPKKHSKELKQIPIMMSDLSKKKSKKSSEKQSPLKQSEYFSMIPQKYPGLEEEKNKSIFKTPKKDRVFD